MRLSDAIALGRTIAKAVPEELSNHRGDEACALGMAGLACGLSGWELHNPEFTFCGAKIEADSHYDLIYERWPWLKNQTSSKFPCGCVVLGEELFDEVVMHLFDVHIFNRKDWTLDQLIDWVRSVEPQEAPAEAESRTPAAPAMALAKG
jgi:hypothetical protein